MSVSCGKEFRASTECTVSNESLDVWETTGTLAYFVYAQAIG